MDARACPNSQVWVRFTSGVEEEYRFDVLNFWTKGGDLWVRLDRVPMPAGTAIPVAEFPLSSVVDSRPDLRAAIG